MRIAGLSLLALFNTAIPLPAQEPTRNDLLFAIEKQLRAAHVSAGPCVGCVVVSRSEKYPTKPVGANDVPGSLGTYDPIQFLKDNPTTKAALARSLDLSIIDNIPDHGFACCVVIDDKGLILTPYHVIDGATKIYVHLPGRIGSYADIHAADARNDLAVLKLISPPAGLKAIKFADVQLRDGPGRRATVTGGKLVVLMANPYASNFPVDKPSAALGSITNLRANLTNGTEKMRRLDNYYDHGPFLEHDAKLNAGVSGAALLNLDGEMIGLTTTALAGAGDRTAEGALPLTEPLQRIIDVLRRGEEVDGGYLGITLPIGGGGADGVQIGSAIPLGPASRVGIVAYDTITHVNGSRVRTYDDLLAHIGSALAGTKVTLTVRGPRQTRDVVLTLGKWPHNRPVIASGRPAPVFGLRVDHDSILAQEIDQNPQAILGIAEYGIPVGVSVREVLADSPAASAFKTLGDRPKRWLITHVNGMAISSPTQFYSASKEQKTIKLTVIDPTEAKRQPREVSFP